MSPGALVFLVLSWSAVLGLTGWAFSRVFRAQRNRADPSNRNTHEP